MGLVLYYGLAIVVFLAFCIYDLLFYVTYKDDECPEIQYTTARLLIDLHNHRVFQTATDNTTATNTTATDTTATVTNTVVLMPLFLVMLYGGIIVLCLFAMLGIYCFGGMSSDRFGNLNMCWACCGIYVRNFAFLTRLLSFVALILIGIHAALTYFNEECQEADHQYTVDKTIHTETGAMYRASQTVVLVNLAFWGFIHCLMPLLKFFIDTEAFLYEPYDRDKSAFTYVCCSVLGP